MERLGSPQSYHVLVDIHQYQLVEGAQCFYQDSACLPSVAQPISACEILHCFLLAH